MCLGDRSTHTTLAFNFKCMSYWYHRHSAPVMQWLFAVTSCQSELHLPMSIRVQDCKGTWWSKNLWHKYTTSPTRYSVSNSKRANRHYTVSRPVGVYPCMSLLFCFPSSTDPFSNTLLLQWLHQSQQQPSEENSRKCSIICFIPPEYSWPWSSLFSHDRLEESLLWVTRRIQQRRRKLHHVQHFFIVRWHLDRRRNSSMSFVPH